jgi:hydrogenase nickel incorporation protein HypA/HybF
MSIRERRPLMHEMALAGSILDCVLRHAGDRKVVHVQVKVGHLRQAVPSSLEFSWQLISNGTVAEGAPLGIEAIGIVAECRDCTVESPQTGFPFRCSGCGGLDLEVRQGNEFLIDWIEVENLVPA